MFLAVQSTVEPEIGGEKVDEMPKYYCVEGGKTLAGGERTRGGAAQSCSLYDTHAAFSIPNSDLEIKLCSVVSMNVQYNPYQLAHQQSETRKPERSATWFQVMTHSGEK